MRACVHMHTHLKKKVDLIVNSTIQLKITELLKLNENYVFRMLKRSLKALSLNKKKKPCSLVQVDDCC